MLLQRLRDYADHRLRLPPTLYTEKPVRYIIELSSSGRLLSPAPIDTADPSHRAVRRGEPRAVPHIKRQGTGATPFLLADNAEYTFGLSREGSRPDRVRACHAAFLDLLRRCAAETAERSVAIVQQFLEHDPLHSLRLPPDFDAGAIITFRVGGEFVVDLPAVQAFWAALHDPAGSGRPGSRVMQCLVCGEERPALSVVPENLKGIPSGQTSGTALISANKEAFGSYGLKQSHIAPTCAACGERFTKAANALLEDERSRITVGGAAFIFWTREPDDAFDLRSWMTDPQPAEVRALLDAARTGRWNPEVDDNAFYATVLSGSGGRAVVRDWIDTTVGDAKRQLGRWFRRQAIVGLYGEEPRPLGLWALAASTVRDAARELAPPTPRALWRSALTGTPLPEALLYQAVRRNRAEGGVTRPRAALIKLVLLSQEPAEEEEDEAMVKLDAAYPSAAYHCGRLLAVLEEAQRLAIPGVKASIVDRFFGTASSAPASVFARLVRGAQPHLAKLERDRPGVWRALQRRLEEIQGQLSASPRTLALRDQGLFALGAYHQRAHDRAQAREAAERRRAGAPTPEDALPETALDDTAPSEAEGGN